MGNQELESETNEPEKSYRIVTYYTNKLPPDLLNIIRAPFLNHARTGNDFFKLTDRDAYYKHYGMFVNNLLQRDETQIRFAMLKKDEVLGWCMFHDKVVHFVWVDKQQWRQGIGKSLLPKEFDTI